MRILIIPDSFKENLSATAVSKAIRKGVFSVIPKAEIREIPFSDGGEGALDVLLQHAKGNIVKCKTENVLGQKIEAQYFRFEEKKTAWIELSQASGLAQIPVENRNALKASTY
ncbi:MAG: glycerate kinase, partial [Flavobacteriaceae bacterium]